MTKLDPFYPIVDNADWLEKLLPTGIKLVQLRMKDRHGNIPDEATRKSEIIRARDLCNEANCQLVVNDFWQIAIDEGCDYVHLGQEDLDDADLKAIRKAGIKLGISTHDEAELERALACNPDYIALGPIYPTILKEMKWDAQGLDKITRWKKQVGDIPLCAIGGINQDRAAGCFDAGADIVSVVTDILLSDTPEERCTQWLQLTRQKAL